MEVVVASRVYALDSSPEFEAFIGEVRRLQDVCVQRMTVGRCDGFESYLEARGEWQAYERVVSIMDAARDVVLGN